MSGCYTQVNSSNCIASTTISVDSIISSDVRGKTIDISSPDGSAWYDVIDDTGVSQGRVKVT